MAQYLTTLTFLLSSSASIALAQSNPVPLVDLPTAPVSVAPLGAAFTLTVNGAGFVPASVVQWNGAALATTFVSSILFFKQKTAYEIATATTATVTVVNPGPGG